MATLCEAVELRVWGSECWGFSFSWEDCLSGDLAPEDTFHCLGSAHLRTFVSRVRGFQGAVVNSCGSSSFASGLV